MKVVISLINTEDAPEEVVIMHYRKPDENNAPELVAQYPIGLTMQLSSSVVLQDVTPGDMIIPV